MKARISDKEIKKAFGTPGLLHRHLGIPAGQKIGRQRLEEAANSKNPTIRKEAQVALNFSRKKK